MMFNEKKPNVWIINTESVGELRARQGIAEKINPFYETFNLQGKSTDELKAFFREKFSTNRLHGHQEWPDILVSSGKQGADAARITKRLSGKKIFLVHSQNPREYYEEYDLIAIPKHLARATHKIMPNVITTLGVPHAITEEKLKTGIRKYGDLFSDLPSPKIAVLLGGNSQSFQFTPALAKEFARKINAVARNEHGSVIVTTSRRTGRNIANAFMAEITVPSYLYDWQLNDGKGTPYLGVLGCADAIIVSGDSMTMPCEAQTRNPVYIYAIKGNIPESHLKLHQLLYSNNLARPFDQLIADGIQQWDYEPVNVAQQIAEQALIRWSKKQAELRPNSSMVLPIGNVASRIIARRKGIDYRKSTNMVHELLSRTTEGLIALQTALRNPDKLGSSFACAVELVEKANGRILITGVGKSLRVGEVVAASFGSLGIPCEIIDPNHALHGDMGKMNKKAGNILIAISKSGNTEELKPVIEKALKRGLNIISVTHIEDSFLGRTAKELGEKGVLLHIPLTEEPHPFPEADTKVTPPTVSTTQVKALLEGLALAVAKSKGINISHFGENHPAGALGHASRVGQLSQNLSIQQLTSR